MSWALGLDRKRNEMKWEKSYQGPEVLHVAVSEGSNKGLGQTRVAGWPPNPG